MRRVSEDTALINKPIVIDVPVADLPRAKAFFQALGFSNNPQFTGETSACVVLNEAAFVMSLPHDRFREFTTKAICDTAKAVEVLFCLMCESTEEVDGLVAKAVAAGGTADKAEDFGFMYSHGFVDPDGHHWGLAYMRGTPSQ